MLLREKQFVRPPERLHPADQPWKPGGEEFATPGLFSNSGTRIPDGRQLTDYGAADREIGLVSVEFNEHVRFLKSRNR